MSGVIMYSIHHCWMLMIFHCWLSIWNRYPSSKFAMPLSARDAKRNCLLAVLHVSKLEHLLCFNGSVCRMNHMITLLYVFLFLFYLKKRSGVNNYFVACGDHWSRSLTTQVVSMFWQWGKLTIGHNWHISATFLFGLDLDAFVPAPCRSTWSEGLAVGHGISWRW
jgi:hypothetical protein